MKTRRGAKDPSEVGLPHSGEETRYGVNGNLEAIQKFYYYAETMLYKMLNRRSQRKSMGYDKFRRIWHYYIKPPKIMKNIWNGTPRNA